MKYCFVAQCGGYVELWTLLLADANEWFPGKVTNKTCHIFCVRFKIEDCTWWVGRTEFQPVLKNYLQWCYG